MVSPLETIRTADGTLTGNRWVPSVAIDSCVTRCTVVGVGDSPVAVVRLRPFPSEANVSQAVYLLTFPE